ncbi:Hypothetical_protein [Hexamita inflata]|uniref:Hypothetical_protein n=1 Tax=Hexamita inflata TaxID=28002 RepID=A0AA86UF23_9EUKA|nr:Hypothetical protein HINF_LOCUS26013 [Hexamita inflata]
MYSCRQKLYDRGCVGFFQMDKEFNGDVIIHIYGHNEVRVIAERSLILEILKDAQLKVTEWQLKVFLIRKLVIMAQQYFHSLTNHFNIVIMQYFRRSISQYSQMQIRKVVQLKIFEQY